MEPDWPTPVADPKAIPVVVVPGAQDELLHAEQLSQLLHACGRQETPFFDNICVLASQKRGEGVRFRELEQSQSDQCRLPLDL